MPIVKLKARQHFQAWEIVSSLDKLHKLHEAFLGAKRPQVNQFILGITSLWMLIPGVSRVITTVGNIGLDDLASIMAIIVALVSVLHWRRCEKDSLLRQLDRTLAVCYYLVLCALTRSVCFGSSVMLFYLTAQWCLCVVGLRVTSSLTCAFDLWGTGGRARCVLM